MRQQGLSRSRLRSLVISALIAAIYAALSLALAPFSFGEVQLRVSEALTILPVFSAACIPGVTVGCAIANVLGVLMGMNTLGFIDVIVGTAATFVSALLTRPLRNIKWFGLPIAATLRPVIINAAAVGAELCFVISGGFSLKVFLPLAGAIAVGQLLSCTVVGLILYKSLERANINWS